MKILVQNFTSIILINFISCSVVLAGQIGYSDNSYMAGDTLTNGHER